MLITTEVSFVTSIYTKCEQNGGYKNGTTGYCKMFVSIARSKTREEVVYKVVLVFLHLLCRNLYS